MGGSVASSLLLTSTRGSVESTSFIGDGAKGEGGSTVSARIRSPGKRSSVTIRPMPPKNSFCRKEMVSCQAGREKI